MDAHLVQFFFRSDLKSITDFENEEKEPGNRFSTFQKPLLALRIIFFGELVAEYHHFSPPTLDLVTLHTIIPNALMTAQQSEYRSKIKGRGEK